MKSHIDLTLCSMVSLLGCFWRTRIVTAFSVARRSKPFLFEGRPTTLISQRPEQHQYARFLSRTSRVRPLSVYSDKEADIADHVEQMVGGERFEMSELPDSMLDTTLFVGNLCEFVNDDDLSNLFRSVSSLQSIPACVVRKPDMTSRQFGFVAFPTVQEKEAAILRFHNYEWRGQSLKVEPIKDHPTAGRVRLPERMISYVSGPVKKSFSNSNNKPLNSLRRISRDDVERLSRGQPAKKKGYGSRSVPHRLNDVERAELNRAKRKGFVSLVGGGNRRTRKGSPLGNIFRQWCDAREKPQVILYKSTGSETKQPLDRILVDLSPLRLLGSKNTPGDVETAMNEYRREIEQVALDAGMALCREGDGGFENPSFVARDRISDEYDDEVIDDDHDYKDMDEMSADSSLLDASATLQKTWATKPIWQLPFTVVGEYEGQRSQAKAMAKLLSILWEIPEEDKGDSGTDGRRDKGGPQSRRSAGAKKGGKAKMKGLSHHRKRGGGHRQSWY